jgi:hypothetical protein
MEEHQLFVKIRDTFGQKSPELGAYKGLLIRAGKYQQDMYEAKALALKIDKMVGIYTDGMCPTAPVAIRKLLKPYTGLPARREG